MANRININGIELTIEQTFPYVAKTESIVEETVVEVKEERPTKKGKKGKKEVVEDESTVEETEVTEETTNEVVDEPKDEE